MPKLQKIRHGFSLVEMVVGAAVFSIIAVAVFQSYSSFISLVALGKWKVAAADLANADFELIRAMPYADVGIVNSVPSGLLSATSSVIVDNNIFNITRTVRNIDDPFDGTIGGNPNDLSPADYKMIQIHIECSSCKNFTPTSIVGYVSPKNLETTSGNGALFVKVFDANGNPVQDTSVGIQSLSGQVISINDVTDDQGLLAIVDMPPGINNYRIIAAKTGFTVDRTYATSTNNPNPTKPDATVVVGQVTQVSFVIDKTSSIFIRAKDPFCSAIGDVPFTLTGSKLIGDSPDVIKFQESYITDSLGEKNISGVEWDTFSLSLESVQYYLAGINPIGLVSVLPDSVQNIDMILTDDLPQHLLVSVKDSSTGLPLSEVFLTLSKEGFSLGKFTGRGSVEQTDWSGGDGQINFSDSTKYLDQDGNIETLNPFGEIRLYDSLGHYSFSGILTSSVFDVGTSSNWGNIQWSPTSQPVQTGNGSVKFQIATSLENTATSTWDFKGPDGTNNSFYDVSDSNINSVHDGDRYFKYRVFLSTLDDAYTPNVSNIALTFTSSCLPPGQAIFSALPSDNFNLLIEKTGYVNQIIPLNLDENWEMVEVNLMPE